MNQEDRSGDRSAAGQPVGAEPLPLLTTKLYRPPARPDLERRPRLLERLEQNRYRALTLILAPAGYGKTMLASMWLEACGCPSAWVSLDETDNDLQTFASYLLAAVQSIFPTLELKTQSVLEAPVLPPATVLARYLLNDVEQMPEPFILALDDVHLIRDQSILDLLSELLRHPPQAMHLVLIGRRDPTLPIASLRAHWQVTEIRTQDLRFTPEEAARLLGTLLNREIDDAAVREWTERTEGWVTGLLLAALSLRHRAETDKVRLDIPEHSPYLQDYLVAEVLATLPPARRDWLLLVSLLDRFCAPLCEVVGRPETAAGQAGLAGRTDQAGRVDRVGIEFIRWLQADNLFLIPLDDRAEWFRFHHLLQQLLQDRLQERLPPEEIAAAHLRVSRWFAQEGLIEEALQHALAGGDVQGAVRLVEQHRYHLMNTEQWYRLERWLKLLPEEAVAQSPRLLSATAYLVSTLGRQLESARVSQQIERLLATLPPETAEYQTMQAEVAVIQGLLDIITGNPARAVASAQRSLELLPPLAQYIRSMAVGILAGGLQMQGDLRQAVAVIRQALEDRTWLPGLRARKMVYLCIVYMLDGELPDVLRSARECLRIAEAHQFLESVSIARYFLGVAHYMCNEFAQAEPYLLGLLEDRATSGPSYLANGLFALALIRVARGRLDEAKQIIELLSAQLKEEKGSRAQASTEVFRVELALRQGKLAQARSLSANSTSDVYAPTWFFYVPQLTPLKLLLAEGSDHSLDEARRRLEALDEQMGKICRNNVRIDVLALQALVCDAQGDEQTALEKLTAALDLGIVGGNIRCFVDLGPPMANLLLRLRQRGATTRQAEYVDRILAAFDPGTDDRQPPTSGSTAGPASHPLLREAGELIEPLTERELEVLELLAQRLTYKEIGAQLFIATGTVSQHAVRTYRKLQVNNRRQAVVKAQALGILPRR